MMHEIDRRMYMTTAKLQAFARRVDASRAVILRAASLGKCIVSTSWGKDSVVLCDLVIDTLGSDVDLFHMASPYALPGYDAVLEHFSRRARVHTLDASRTLSEYIEWCREIGLPHERAGGPSVGGRAKSARSREWTREHGVDVTIMGLRVAEKGPRAKMLRAKGQLFELADGGWRSNPLAWWSSREIWAYIISRGVPYNHAIYDAETHDLTRETIRNTGWLSTDGAERGRLAWLREHFPEQWRMLVDAFPQTYALSGG